MKASFFHQNESNSSPPRGASGIPLRVALVGALVLVLLSSVGVYGAIFYTHRDYFEKSATLRRLESSDNWEAFLQLITIITNEYVDPDKATPDRLLEGAMNGAVRSLDDPYSNYFDKRHLENFQIETSGLYQGIGVMVVERTVDEKPQVTVVSPFEGTPAATTAFEGSGPSDPRGLKPGDIILRVDDREVTGLPVDTVARMIRGPDGTVVNLDVLREGRKEPLHFKIVRSSITVPTTRSRMLPGGQRIGYLQVTMFQESTAAQVKEDLAELEKKEMRALVLDLRNNPGGLLNVSAEVAEIFVPRGTIVTVLERGGGKEAYFSETAAYPLPFVVLVNKGSASAAEIVAGAVQDYGVAPLVGETTFGKGSVQRIWTLDGNSGRSGGSSGGLSITTAKYLTAQGRSIDHEGLKPDIEVAQPEWAVLGQVGKDPQLDKALELLQKELGKQ